MNQSFTSPEILGLSLLSGNALIDAVLHKFRSNSDNLKGFLLLFCLCVLWVFLLGFFQAIISTKMQSNAQEKKRPCGPISVTNTHKLQVAPELCIEAQLPGLVEPALTAAMAQLICHWTNVGWRVGWREGGGVSILDGLARVMAFSRHSRKPWSWKRGLCSPTRSETRRGIFSLLAASNQGQAISESAGGWAAPLAVGGRQVPSVHCCRFL